MAQQLSPKNGVNPPPKETIETLEELKTALEELSMFGTARLIGRCMKKGFGISFYDKAMKRHTAAGNTISEVVNHALKIQRSSKKPR